jgi:hypothetical protein
VFGVLTFVLILLGKSAGAHLRAQRVDESWKPPLDVKFAINPIDNLDFASRLRLSRCAGVCVFGVAAKTLSCTFFGR